MKINPSLPSMNFVGLKSFNKRVGASLMETSFVLLVIVGIIAGALAMAYSVMGQSTVTQETQILSNLSGATLRTKGNNGFASSTNIMKAMDEMKLVPTNVSRTGTGAAMVLRNGWGGVITIKPINSGGNFAITYAQVPKSDCIQLLNTVKPGILQSVGSGSNPTMNMTALTPTLISTSLCSGSTNTVTWGNNLI